MNSTDSKELEKKKQEVREHNKKFLVGYEDAANQWHETHKNKQGKSPNPPVYTDKDGKYRWSNRKQRRLAQKQAMKARKHAERKKLREQKQAISDKNREASAQKEKEISQSKGTPQSESAQKEKVDAI